MRQAAFRSIIFVVLAIFAGRLAAATQVVAPRYYVTTVAGVPNVAGFHDGPALEATFDKPTWLDIHPGANCSAGTQGDIYVTDRLNGAVRIISGSTVRTFTTRDVAPQYGYTFDFGGPVGGGILMEPTGAGCGCGEYDAGFFVASSGHGEVPLLSFTGSVAFRDAIIILGRPAPGAPAGDPLRMPTGLARSVHYNGGPIVTDPYDRVRERFLFIADSGDHTIRRVPWALSAEACPVAYTTPVYAGARDEAGSADGAGSSARFNVPRGLATGPDGSVYVADSGNHTIRRIDSDGAVATIAGEAGVAGSDDGPALRAHLNTPAGIDVNAKGEVFIADTGNHTIRLLTTDGLLLTIAGNAGEAGSADGFADAARFNGPVGLRIAPDGSIIIADTSNHTIRRLFIPSPRRRAIR